MCDNVAIWNLATRHYSWGGCVSCWRHVSPGVDSAIGGCCHPDPRYNDRFRHKNLLELVICRRVVGARRANSESFAVGPHQIDGTIFYCIVNSVVSSLVRGKDTTTTYRIGKPNCYPRKKRRAQPCLADCGTLGSRRPRKIDSRIRNNSIGRHDHPWQWRFRGCRSRRISRTRRRREGLFSFRERCARRCYQDPGLLADKMWRGVSQKPPIHHLAAI